MKKLIPLIFSVLFIAFYSCDDSTIIDDMDAIQTDKNGPPEDRGPDKDDDNGKPDWGYDYTSYESTEIPGCTSETYKLIAGQYIDVGSLIVSNDKDNLYVTFVQDEFYTQGKLKETHVFVGCGPDEIPVNGPGNPNHGHFPFSDDHGEVMQYTYEIPLNQFDCDTECLTIVAHASIGEETAYGGCELDESGRVGSFGDGQRWGCYFEYCPQECEDECLEAFAYKHLNPEHSICLNYENIDDDEILLWSNNFNFRYLDGQTYPMLLLASSEDCIPYGDGQITDSNSILIGNVDITLYREGEDLYADIKYIISDDSYELSDANLFLAKDNENPEDLDPDNGDYNYSMSSPEWNSETNTFVKVPWPGEYRAWDTYLISHAGICKK